MLGEYVRDHYLKVKLIKKTSKKEIWLLKNTLDGDLVIGKIQPFPLNDSKNARNVLHQGKFMQMAQGHLGIPFLHWAGKEEDQGISVIIVQRLGDTIQDKFNAFGPFSLKTACLLGIQMIQILCDYHQKGYVHGNIKLNSYQFGHGKQSQKLYLNDLLFSHSWTRKSGKSRKQIARIKQQIDQFMSVDRMLGYQSCKKDDIQAVILLLIFFIKGKLPWSALVATIISQNSFSQEKDCQTDSKIINISKEITSEDSKFDKIRAKRDQIQKLTEKMVAKIDQMPISIICDGVPKEINTMLIKIRETKYDERPDYNFFIRCLRKLLLKNHWDQNQIFDWTHQQKHLRIDKKSTIQNLILNQEQQQWLLQQCYLPYCEKIQLS